MLNPKIFLDDYEVLCSGSLLVPKDINEVKINLDPLLVAFNFIERKGDPGLGFSGKGETLEISIYNYSYEAAGYGRGRAATFMRIGAYQGVPLYISFIVHVKKSKAKILEYTFATVGLDSEDFQDD